MSEKAKRNAAQPFPLIGAEPVFPLIEADPVAAELSKILKSQNADLFPMLPAYTREERERLAEAAAKFAAASAKVLAFVLSREISENRKQALVGSFLLACCYSREGGLVLRDSIKRLESALKREKVNRHTRKARKAKQHNSDKAEELIKHRAIRYWKRQPARRGSALATAQGIFEDVNKDLAAHGLPSFTVGTIRKRIKSWHD